MLYIYTHKVRLQKYLRFIRNTILSVMDTFTQTSRCTQLYACMKRAQKNKIILNIIDVKTMVVGTLSLLQLETAINHHLDRDERKLRPPVQL